GLRDPGVVAAGEGPALDGALAHAVGAGRGGARRGAVAGGHEPARAAAPYREADRAADRAAAEVEGVASAQVVPEGERPFPNEGARPFARPHHPDRPGVGAAA